jgi:hypothetical protein
MFPYYNEQMGPAGPIRFNGITTRERWLKPMSDNKPNQSEENPRRASTADSGKKLSSDTIIGIAATVIALASLWLSASEGYQTRLHDHLSVKPYLTVLNNLVEKEPEFGVLVTNKGIGPAFVRELRIFVDGKPVAPDQYDGWGNARMQLGINELPVHCSGLSESAISAGETIPLLAIKKEDQTNERDTQLQKAVGRLKIVIVYESIYGEKHTATGGGEP